MPKTGEQHKFTVWLLWRPEVLDQGVSRAMLSLKVPGKDLFQGSLLVSGSPLVYGSIIPVLTSVPMYAYLRPNLPFSKDTAHFV